MFRDELFRGRLLLQTLVKNYIHGGLIILSHLGKLGYAVQMMVIDMVSIKVAGEQVKFICTCISLQRITTYMPK